MYCHWGLVNKQQKNPLQEQSENLKRVKSEENVKAVIVKVHEVLLQQGNQYAGDSQQMVLTDSGQTVVDSSGRSDTKPRDGKVWGTDRQWTDCRREQWT